jgi:hypothetical protein
MDGQLPRKLVEDELKVKYKKPCTTKNVLEYVLIERQKISKQIYRRSTSDAELIDLAKEMRNYQEHGEELNLTEEDLAFVI